jgi:hypothetical protein
MMRMNVECIADLKGLVDKCHNNIYNTKMNVMGMYWRKPDVISHIPGSRLITTQ